MTAKERKQIASIFRRAAEISDQRISTGNSGFCCSAIIDATESRIDERAVLSIFYRLFFSETCDGTLAWWKYENRHARPIALLLAAEIIESGDWE